MGQRSDSGGGNKSHSEHYEATRNGEHLRDPYILPNAFSENNICPVCNAVYHKKHWSFDPSLVHEARKDKNAKADKCPACRKVEDKYAMGKVFLSGSFINEHVDELINIIKSEERRAKENNPLDRLILIEKRDGNIYAETTSDALAMRIGHHLKESYKGGDENFKFRRGDKFVEVHWQREIL